MTEWTDQHGDQIATRPFSELVAEGYKRWYQFGARSPRILWKRLRNKHMPLRRTRWAVQRARRGYSDSDVWGFDGYLAAVIAGGVAQLRANLHGYAPEVGSIEEWDEILAKIETGFRVYLDEDEKWLYGDDPELRAQVDEARELFVKWFDHLWD